MAHRAFRYDVTKLTGPIIDHRGYLHATATIARTGIQEYPMPDGSVRRELRPDKEVTHPDSLATLKGSVATNDHPPMALDTKNTKSYAVGNFKGEPTKVKGKKGNTLLQDEMVVHDDRAIKDVMEGKNQISMGYFCDVEMTPGTDPVYGKYDAIQRNIVHNHGAIVSEGRAGDEVKIKMDSKGKAFEDFAICYRADEDEDSDGDAGGDTDYDEDEDDIEIDAKWSNAMKRALPKDSFAYMGTDGKGKLPFKNQKGEIDIPHLKNALARLEKTDIPASAKAKAKSKLEAAAKENNVGMQKKDFANSQAELNSQKEGESLMIIFKIDGMEYQLDDKYDAVLTKVTAKLEELKALKSDNAQLAKNLDESKVEIEKLKVIVADEKGAEQRVEERIQVKAVAKEMFPEETKLDSLSTLELQKKIVKKTFPEMEIEKQDSAVIKGISIGIIGSFKTDGTRAIEAGLTNLKKDCDEPKFDRKKAEEQLKKAYNNGYKKDYLEKHDKGYVTPES